MPTLTDLRQLMEALVTFAAFVVGMIFSLQGSDGWQDLTLFGCIVVLTLAGMLGWWHHLRT